MKVALTFYWPGGTVTAFRSMPTVPRVGDRLHAPEHLPTGAPLRSWLVKSVTWEELGDADSGRSEWVAEVVLSQ